MRRSLAFHEEPTPEFDEFCSHLKTGNLVPVFREILADMETPVSAFRKIDDGGDAFLLESVEHAERWGRYSFLGVKPRRVLRSKGNRIEIDTPGSATIVKAVADPFAEIKTFLAPFRPVPLPGLPLFDGGALGYIGYDIVRYFENLPDTTHDDLGVPDQYLMLVDTFLVFDNTSKTIKVVSHADVSAGASPREAYAAACARIDELISRLRSPVPPGAPTSPADGPAEAEPNVSPAEYEQMVRQAKEYILSGDIIQVVLSQRHRLPLRTDPFSIYRCLRIINPAPYMFYLRLGTNTLIGSSPEVMARLDGDCITVRPIAGTRPRGTDERADREFERELASDPKEIAEHVMLVDLGRNDVGRVAATGSVEVTERMIVERYSHVMHLVSNVRGRLAAGKDCFDVFRATFPAGTLSGAPKIRAMEIIEELEPSKRGIYGGAVGYFSFSGDMDTCIAIRTLLARGNDLFVQAGAGIVADSVPEREHAECLNKARAMIQAIRLAESHARLE